MKTWHNSPSWRAHIKMIHTTHGLGYREIFNQMCICAINPPRQDKRFIFKSYFYSKLLINYPAGSIIKGAGKETLALKKVIPSAEINSMKSKYNPPCQQ